MPGRKPLLAERLQEHALGPSCWPSSSSRNSRQLLAPGSSGALGGSLNSSQLEASHGLLTGISCIHGPPGTGKSTTIHYIIAQCLGRGVTQVRLGMKHLMTEAAQLGLYRFIKAAQIWEFTMMVNSMMIIHG